MAAKKSRRVRLPNPGMPIFDADGFQSTATWRVANYGFTHPARTLTAREVIDARPGWKAGCRRATLKGGPRAIEPHEAMHEVEDPVHCPRCDRLMKYVRGNTWKCKHCGHRHTFPPWGR